MGKLINGSDWFKPRVSFEDGEFRDHVLETLDDFEERCEHRLKFTSVSSQIERSAGYSLVTACATVMVPI